MDDSKDKKKFDPYTGNPIDELPYEEAAWKPVESESKMRGAEAEESESQPEQSKPVSDSEEKAQPADKSARDKTGQSDSKLEQPKTQNDSKAGYPLAASYRELEQGGRQAQENKREERQRGEYHRESPRPNREEKQEENGLSMACLILGILSIVASVSFCFTIFSIPLAIASIVCGCLAGNQNNKKDKTRLAGFITSGIGIAFSIIIILIIVLTVIFSDRIIMDKNLNDTGVEYFWGSEQQDSDTDYNSHF